MAANECIPLYEPGAAISAKATAAVTGKRLVAVSGDPDNANFPGLESDADVASAVTGTNQPKFAHATAAERADGVSSYDAPNGGHFYVIGQNCGEAIPVTADGAITAGDDLEVGTAGKAAVHSAGVIVGTALNSCADGEDVFIVNPKF